MILLEREDQLGALQELLVEAGAGRGRVVALAGEAGAGKTSLVEAFAAASCGDARVYRSACEDLSIPDPLGPLYDLARDAAWAISRASQERLPLFSDALAAFADAATATVLVIEDLHWADDATLDFVRYLGRRIAGTHLLLLLTARNDSSDGQKRLRRALGDMPPANVRRIEVPLLSETAVRTLASGTGVDGRQIYTATAGNAFFVTELLRAGGEATAPGVRDATLARAERLGVEARATLDALSVFPRRAELTVLQAMLGPDAEERLNECVAHGMLAVSGDGYAFRHEIARRAVEAALPAHRRRALNAAALAALRALPEVAPARLVHHAAEARDADALRELAPKAAYEASRIGAHREAADHYCAMLDLEQGFTPEERAVISMRFAYECHLIGRAPQAIVAQERARAIYHELGDQVMEGDCLRWLSRLSYLVGERENADRYGAQAIALLETQPPGPELAMAYSNLSQLAMLNDDPDNALTYGKSAIALGQVLGRPDIMSHALNNMGATRIWVDPDQGRRDLDRSLDLALEHNFHEHAARTYTNRGCFEIYALDYPAARSVLERGIAYCIDHDIDTWHYYMQGWLAEVLLRQGHWIDAADHALPIAADENATTLMRYNAQLALARMRLRRGDPAFDPLREDIERYLATGLELQRLAPYATLMAERAWLGLGDRDEALRLLQQAEELTPKRVVFAELIAWRRRLDPEAPLGDVAGVPAPYAAEFAGDWASAASHWGRIGAPFEQALVMLEGDEAAQRAALQIFEDLSAKPFADKARALMRQQGIDNIARGPRESTRTNVLGLTRRQMEILAMLGRGLSSKRIAAEFAISPKTVDHHVAAVLEKLGAHTRGEAVVAAREKGLV